MIELTLYLSHPWPNRRSFDAMEWYDKKKLTEKYANEFRKQIYELGLPGEMELVDVEIHAQRIGGRSLDRDNLTAGLKPVLDAMVKATDRNPRGIGIILDDRPSIIKKLSTEQFKKEKDNKKSSVFFITGRMKDEA